MQSIGIRYTDIYINRQSQQASRATVPKLDLRSAIEIIIIIILTSSLINKPHFGNLPHHIHDTRHSLISQFCPDKRNCMSSKEEDKNKQTGTPTQRRVRREDRELARQRAEAKSPEVGKLQPLGKSRVSWVSPELSTPKKGGNKSDTKEKEGEEGEGEEEGNKKAGDKEEEEEDPKKDNNSSNSPNSNMAPALVAIAPFDLDLTHLLTIVCGFLNPSAPINAVTEYGITTFDEFRSTEYDIAWTHTVNNATIAVTGSNAVILSASIAWARDLETKQHPDSD